MVTTSVLCLLLLASASAILAVSTVVKDGGCIAKIKCEYKPRTCRDVIDKDDDGYEDAMMYDNTVMLCNTQLDGGGWTVIQRRVKGQLVFYREWEEYKFGFSDEYGDFWYGLEKIHHLTTMRSHELYVSFDYKGKSYYANYKQFMVMSEKENYRMYVSGYSGTAGDSMARHNGAMFTTQDKDNDSSPNRNCAKVYKGAWWYVDCHSSNLNGEWGNEVYGEGVNWRTTTTYTGSATNVVMMIRSVV